jgi:hypothetical protein
MGTRVFASDEGNAKWRLSVTNIYSAGVTHDIIATTNGAGNIKGVHCESPYELTLSVYVNGGSAETFTYDPALSDDGFVPFNIRFTSSIRVTGYRSSGSGGSHACFVSWGLD